MSAHWSDQMTTSRKANFVVSASLHIELCFRFGHFSPLAISTVYDVILWMRPITRSFVSSAILSHAKERRSKYKAYITSCICMYTFQRKYVCSQTTEQNRVSVEREKCQCESIRFSMHVQTKEKEIEHNMSESFLLFL